jgi:hypothetical protein
MHLLSEQFQPPRGSRAVAFAPHPAGTVRLHAISVPGHDGCTLRKLRHNTKVRLGLKSVEHLDDVLVTQLAKDFYFLTQVLDVLLALAMLHDKFHSRDLPSELPSAPIDLQHVSSYAMQNLAIRGSRLHGSHTYHRKLQQKFYSSQAFERTVLCDELLAAQPMAPRGTRMGATRPNPPESTELKQDSKTCGSHGNHLPEGTLPHQVYDMVVVHLLWQFGRSGVRCYA